MAVTEKRLGVLFVLFLLAAAAGAVAIHLSFEEPAPPSLEGELPFAPDPAPEAETAPAPAPSPSPFGVITKREPSREAGVTDRVPRARGPKVIEVPPALRGVTSGWHRDAAGYRAAISQHERDRTPMLLYFRVDWCPSCRAFDRDVLSAREAEDCRRAAVKAMINPDHGQEEKALANRYGVRGYPTLLVISEPGASPRRVSSAVRRVGGGLRGDPGAFNRSCKSVLGI